MDEEAGSSWLRRARFSKTVYYRYNRSSSFDSILELEAPVSSKKWVPSHPPIEYHPLTNKQRSLPPLPRSDFVSDSFREAQAESEMKRSLTPHTRRTVGKVMAVETVDEYLVDLSWLHLGDRFARGAYSDLHRGRYKDEVVAVKIITAPDDDENITLKARLEKQFNREVTLLSKLYHPNVIKFVGACRKPPYFYILTEYLSKGSLRSYLHKLELENEPLPLKTLVAIALDIARGMEYIHSQSVIHRDLKPENVLINEAFHMKIADFGIGCHEANCDSFADGPGTFRWMAPEMIKNKSYYGRKVDVYSFGLILWEMVSGSIPYGNLSPYQAAYAAVNKNERPAFTEDCPPVMRAIIEQCWSSKQEKRPEFCQLVRVLEQCESSLVINGTLNLVQNVTFQDRNKGLCYWMQRLSPTHSSSVWNFKFWRLFCHCN